MEGSMRRILATSIGAALACGIVVAQSTPAEHADAAQRQTLTGCIVQGEHASNFRLTEVGKAKSSVLLVEMAPGIDLRKYVGKRVTITASAVTPAATAKAEGTDTASTAGARRVRVERIHQIARTCP